VVGALVLSVAASTVAKVTETLTRGDFTTLTTPLRGELVAHCYRMLGSLQDAEDQVQETYLRAWRAFDGFEGRSSVRTWMYQIATRTCLTALQQRARRPMPTGLGAPTDDPSAPLDTSPEVPWLEPLPDRMVAGTVPGPQGGDPAAVSAARESVRLAFVAALQHLTPQQRAAVILRDVLAFSAAETAGTLQISVAAANSALQRGRASLGRLPGRGDVPSARTAGGRPDGDGPGGPEAAVALAEGELAPDRRDLLERFMRAFEAYDVPGVVALLTQDAGWEMPPFRQWFRGAERIGELIRSQCPAEAPGDLLHRPTSANGQPACAVWFRGPDGVHRAFQLLVLDPVTTPEGPRVRHVSCFFDTRLFAWFELPLELPPA